MNDNMLKTLVCFIAAGWVDEQYKTFVVNFSAGALVLPYMLFSPLAGKLPHFFKKTRIVKTAKILELPIMLVAVLGFEFQNLALALSAVTLMGFQSALFSPSKYGLIKDIGGKDSISQGMGGMEAFAFLGILFGTFLGSVLSEGVSKEIQYAALIGIAVLGVVSSFFVKAKEEYQAEESSANPVTFLKQTAALVSKHKGLKHVIYLLCMYWWLSASIQTLLRGSFDVAFSDGHSLGINGNRHSVGLRFVRKSRQKAFYARLCAAIRICDSGFAHFDFCV